MADLKNKEMENSKQPAFPFTWQNNDGEPCAETGLTKREYFAVKAMQGYVVERHAQVESDMKKIAEWSVKMADQLLIELSKSNPGEEAVK